MSMPNVCRAITIDLHPAEVRRICTDVVRIPSWFPHFANSIELRSKDEDRVLTTGSEAQEGDFATFRVPGDTMTTTISENTERSFAFESLDGIIKIRWEFIPMSTANTTDGNLRTFFKHWEYQKSSRTQFWLRHGPFKKNDYEDLDAFNKALKAECEKTPVGDQV